MDYDDRIEVIECIKEILETHGIRMAIGGCGCCGSPWVSFWYKGEQLLDSEDYTTFDMGRGKSEEPK